MKNKGLVFIFLISITVAYAQPKSSINWPVFMAKQDMVWTSIPKKWQEAPYLGNGMVGLMLFQSRKSKKNELELHVGRGDYYDNRQKMEGEDYNLWTYRGRLPSGYFKVKSIGNVKKINWRLDLYNAVLRGKVFTDEGSYIVEAFVHANEDAFYFETTSSISEKVELTWVPAEAYSVTRKIGEKGIAEKGEKANRHHKNFVKGPYPLAPDPFLTTENEVNYAVQTLYNKRGEQITAWQNFNEANSTKQYILGAAHFSKEVGFSKKKCKQILDDAKNQVLKNSFFKTHKTWWNAYYPKSFLSINDAFWEQFYWIQMYKFASSTREDGMLLDVMGPWYQSGIWPLIWTDLNVQLTYWTPLVANRLEEGASLPNQLDAHIQNLIKNVPKDWQNDCLNAATIFPNDMIAPVSKNVSDHLVWMLHDYWLWCRYADDKERMKNGLFPLLKRATNVYFRYIQENPTPDETDGKIHIKQSWSPEYPGGTGKDINYTLALIRWSCQTLLNISKEHHLNDPMEAKWQNMLNNLVDFQTDENGLRIGAEIPFEKAHRHYSHLLAFYPLFILTPDEDEKLLSTSLDHWLSTSFNLEKKKDAAMAVTGYTCSGAASMYAVLGKGNKALSYLELLPHYNVSSTTMYSEGNNPVIESPFSAATSMHDMLLQSWDGRIRVFPAIPDSWTHIHFENFLCQRGVEVSAEYSDSEFQYACFNMVKADKEIEFKLNFAQPDFMLYDPSGNSKKIQLVKQVNGFYKTILKLGETLIASNGDFKLPESVIKSSAPNNIFGLNERYVEEIR